jgi:hypothetical protein
VATLASSWSSASAPLLELSQIKAIIEDIESRYLLSYQPKDVPKEGWHPLEVKLKKGKKGTVRARQGYMAVASSN